MQFLKRKSVIAVLISLAVVGAFVWGRLTGPSFYDLQVSEIRGMTSGLTASDYANLRVAHTTADLFNAYGAKTYGKGENYGVGFRGDYDYGHGRLTEALVTSRTPGEVVFYEVNCTRAPTKCEADLVMGGFKAKGVADSSTFASCNPVQGCPPPTNGDYVVAALNDGIRKLAKERHEDQNWRRKMFGMI